MGMWAYILAWSLGLLMLPIVARRYEADKAWAWLAIIFVLPFVGLLLFLMLADDPFGRLKRKRYILEQFGGAKHLKLLDPFVVEQPTGDQMWGIDRLTHVGSGLKPVSGNGAEVLTDASGMIDRIIADIDAATHHVHITMYIFVDDQTGRRVAEALARAVKRGVACRVLVDALGSRSLWATLGAWMREQGIELCEAFPAGRFGRRFYRLDVRNHRKLIVIDGALGYIGSRNLINSNYGCEDLEDFAEFMVRCEGPIVSQLQLAFLEDWRVEADQALDESMLFPVPQRRGEFIMQALPSGPMYPGAPVRDVSVAAIHAAHDRVTLTTPYFVPDAPSMLALLIAADRGVRVEVIMSDQSDMRLAQAAARSHFEQMLEHGIDIYRHRPRLVHTKALTVDTHFAMVGSANFDQRSFRLSMETNLLLYSPELVKQVVAVQEQYIRASDRMHLEEWRSRPWHSRMGDDLAKLLGPVF